MGWVQGSHAEHRAPKDPLVWTVDACPGAVMSSPLHKGALSQLCHLAGSSRKPPGSTGWVVLRAPSLGPAWCTLGPRRCCWAGGTLAPRWPGGTGSGWCPSGAAPVSLAMSPRTAWPARVSPEALEASPSCSKEIRSQESPRPALDQIGREEPNGFF